MYSCEGKQKGITKKKLIKCKTFLKLTDRQAAMVTEPIDHFCMGPASQVPQKEQKKKKQL